MEKGYFPHSKKNFCSLQYETGIACTSTRQNRLSRTHSVYSILFIVFPSPRQTQRSRSPETPMHCSYPSLHREMGVPLRVKQTLDLVGAGHQFDQKVCFFAYVVWFSFFLWWGFSCGFCSFVLLLCLLFFFFDLPSNSADPDLKGQETRNWLCFALTSEDHSSSCFLISVGKTNCYNEKNKTKQDISGN